MEHPKLRPIEAFPVDLGGREVICLRDPTQLTDDAVFVPREALFILAHVDGKHSILDIQEAYTRHYGHILYSDAIKDLVAKLDASLLLDNERFAAHKQQLIAAFRASPIRRAAHAGTAYEADPTALGDQLAGYFAAPTGPGSAPALMNDAAVQGILAPHIDPRRGGPCFAWAYEAIRQVTAEVFVIFGTAHQPTSVPFPLTVKDYETPLGIVETDKAFVRALARQINPAEMVHIADFVQAMREVASAHAEPVCYIVGGDLAHVGMKFGDQGGLTPAFLDQVAREDHALLAAAARMDAAGFFRGIAEHHDRRRICGFPPTYMLLSTMPATAGTVLKYDQAVEPATQSMVSYASVVFH